MFIGKILQLRFNDTTNTCDQFIVGGRDIFTSIDENINVAYITNMLQNIVRFYSDVGGLFVFSLKRIIQNLL